MAGEFDTLALRRRANEWRDEAVRVPAGPMRAFCLREACQCERRLWSSTNTPVIRERGIESDWGARGIGIGNTLGGDDRLMNLQLRHRHCHDQKTAQDGSNQARKGQGITDKDRLIEEPCAEKSERTVLKGGG